MICRTCKSLAKFQEYRTFSFHYCETCKEEVLATPKGEESIVYVLDPPKDEDFDLAFWPLDT